MTTVESSAYRYGVYLMPCGAWDQLGSRWLGRNAWTGARVPRAVAADASTDDALIDTWTAEASKYGLHATLKPPFRLAEGETFAHLDAALQELASAQPAFDLPLRLARLRGFLAWRVATSLTDERHIDDYADGDPDDDIARNGDSDTSSAILHLANKCVADLDRFRAPPLGREMARRRMAGLSAAHEANLARWGYPYVFDTFTFHITLTRRLDHQEMDAAVQALSALATPDEATALTDGAAMPVRHIALFVQANPDAPFVVARRYGFDGTVENGCGLR